VGPGDLSAFRLRLHRAEQPRWDLGRINTGVAHGVAGVAAALCVACEFLGTSDEYATALQHLCRWLAGEAYRDAWGVLTWPPAGRDGDSPPATASPRQAWCYGTPGVAWTLWEAGRVLGSPAPQELATEAMASFCAAFAEERYLTDAEPGLRDSLAFCHGAAGTMAVADAFARHAGLAPATVLRDRIEGVLLTRLEEIPLLGEQSMLLLNGATGVLAALLTVQGGSRSWLTQYGLR
jgi:hypothetical protein